MVAEASRRLAGAGVERPRHEARLLVAHALGLTAEDALFRLDRPLVAGQAEAVEAAVERRLAGEPVAYVLGWREFWSIRFRVTGDTLIPRPDSETVVEAALAWARTRPPGISILDLGTGSGCLLLALLSELPQARGVGVDAGEGAVRVARGNAEALGLAARARFLVGDWAGAIRGPFDVVVANPPYVAERDLDALAVEVSGHEPRLALAGGADGLDGARAVADAIGRLLGPAGAAFLEVGMGQAPAAADILAARGLRPIGFRRDLAGIPRVVGAVSGSTAWAEVAKKRVGMEAFPD
jgi:release factor glutamine methyltransferase